MSKNIPLRPVFHFRSALGRNPFFKFWNLNTFLLICLSLFSFLNTNCSSHKRVIKDNKKEYKYFRITANADDDQLFVRLQDDLGIDPKMEVYTMVVDIRPKTLEPYILFGDINESNPAKFPWSRLSKDVQQGLINWTGSNKESLE